MALLAQEAGQGGAIRARALDAEGPDRPHGSRPGFESPVAFAADRDGGRAQARAERVDGDGGMDVLVGVDADDDVGG
jgi:hypothetical protein